MAKSPTKSDTASAEAQPSLAVAMAIVTLVAGGAGAGFAATMLKPSSAEATAAAAVQEAPVNAAKPTKELPNRFPAGAVEVPLAPIVTGLGPSADRKMRLEASVIMTKEAANSATLKTELIEDIVVFLNTVSAEQVSGIRGLQNLREDLDDRARIRGRGMVLGLLISGFVLE